MAKKENKKKKRKEKRQNLYVNVCIVVATSNKTPLNFGFSVSVIWDIFQLLLQF
jgi:hypothetical protein